MCKFRYLFIINEGLVFLKLANTVLILINTGPSNVKLVTWGVNNRDMLLFMKSSLWGLTIQDMSLNETCFCSRLYCNSNRFIV